MTTNDRINSLAEEVSWNCIHADGIRVSVACVSCIAEALRKQRAEIVSGVKRYSLEDDNSCGGCVHNQLVESKDGELVKVLELLSPANSSGHGDDKS